MKIGVRQYATLFTAAMGSLFAGSSAMHAILKPDLVRLQELSRCARPVAVHCGRWAPYVCVDMDRLID